MEAGLHMEAGIFIVGKMGADKSVFLAEKFSDTKTEYPISGCDAVDVRTGELHLRRAAVTVFSEVVYKA